METVQTESPGKVAALTKCAHDGCVCTIAAGEVFCSDYCAEQANADKAASDDECDCGHPECAHQVSARVVMSAPVVN